MRVCVFCGSSHGARPAYAAAARAFGRLLAERGLGLVYGGASVGLMGELADASLAAGGEVIGVIPDRLVERELAHLGLTELRVVSTLSERKIHMAELSAAFVALPGGAGTLDELFEVWTWSVLGVHTKPFGLLEVGSFFAPLVAALDHLVDEGFLAPWARALLVVDEDARSLLDQLLVDQATNSTRTGAS
jgi:uncharacterized protein (TIGR00730 family)